MSEQRSTQGAHTFAGSSHHDEDDKRSENRRALLKGERAIFQLWGKAYKEKGFGNVFFTNGKKSCGGV